MEPSSWKAVPKVLDEVRNRGNINVSTRWLADRVPTTPVPREGILFLSAKISQSQHSWGCATLHGHLVGCKSNKYLRGANTDMIIITLLDEVEHYCSLVSTWFDRVNRLRRPDGVFLKKNLSLRSCLLRVWQRPRIISCSLAFKILSRKKHSSSFQKLIPLFCMIALYLILPYHQNGIKYVVKHLPCIMHCIMLIAFYATHTIDSYVCVYDSLPKC